MDGFRTELRMHWEVFNLNKTQISVLVNVVCTGTLPTFEFFYSLPFGRHF